MFNDSRSRGASGAGTTRGDTITPLVAGGVTALTLSVAFGLMALGVGIFWVAFPVGFGVVLPGAIAIANSRRADEHRGVAENQTTGSPAELEGLRQRYAAGELSDEEFENRVERLLESEVDRPNHSYGPDGKRR